MKVMTMLEWSQKGTQSSGMLAKGVDVGGNYMSINNYII